MSFSLKNVKTLKLSFNPFGQGAVSARQVLGLLKNTKLLKTNAKCKVETHIVESDIALLEIQFRDNDSLVLDCKDHHFHDVLTKLKAKDSKLEIDELLAKARK